MEVARNTPISNINTPPYKLDKLEVFAKQKCTPSSLGHWLALVNAQNNNLVSDVSGVKYVESGDSTMRYIPITEPFCDNIMLFKVFRETQYETEGKRVMVKKEFCGTTNSLIRAYFSTFKLTSRGVTSKNPLFIEGDTSRSRSIALQRLGDVDVKGLVIAPYKVELADIPLNVLLTSLGDIIANLEKEETYFLDFDITQDLAGTFDKEKMCRYLCSESDFTCEEGECYRSTAYIVNNDYSVGRDCLTWLTDNGRFKVYNKFACNLLAPA